MGKVRFELMEFSDGYGCSELDDVSGDYWPDADYRALEAENEQLEKMLKDAVHAVSDDDDEVMALEAENKRLHKYERWFDDIYGMMQNILWDSNKIAWDKEKAFKKLLEICETADQFKVLKKEHNRIQTKLAALVVAVEDVKHLDCYCEANGKKCFNCKLTDKIQAALDAAKEGK